MAPLAVMDGKSHVQVADTAKFPVQYVSHGKVPGPLLLDIEQLGMTAVAVEPCRMGFMGENRGGNKVPLRFEQQFFVKRDVFGPVFEKCTGSDHSAFQGAHPVYPISEQCSGISGEFGEFFRAITDIAVMAFVAMGFVMAEGRFPVMATAGPAKPPRPVGAFRYLRRIYPHGEFQLGMAHPARMPLSVQPVGEGGGLHAVFHGCPVDEDIPVSFLRRQRVKVEITRCRGPGKYAEYRKVQEGDGYDTGFVWHRWQLICGKATLS
jgi:hypothetical protein